ncbi:MAG: hypothetical protein HYU52_07885 [Acidobacteria bacterium]|nr:hypothetical protein [Acidobacteriota bacterium]
MTRFQTGAAVLAATIIAGAIPAFGADFYETQLRLGAESFRAGRFAEAVDYFRIANFGLLERPELLSEGLARLAMANSAAGRKDELDKTLTRFLAIERQYPSWASSAMPDEERAAFEKLLLATLPRESIASVPSLARLVARPAVDESLTPEQRRRQLESKAAAEPSNPAWPLELAREARQRRDDKTALRWAAKALGRDAGTHEAHAIRLSIFTARKDDRAAVAELSATPDEAWSLFPGIIADAFVVYTRTRNYAQADAVAPRVSDADLGRSDVATAMDAWRARLAKAAAEAATEPPAPLPNAAPDVPAVAEDATVTPPATVTPTTTAAATDVPPGSPIAGPGDVVEERTEASRGSFTGAQDRVGATLSQAKKLMSASRAAEAQRLLRDELVKTPGSRELRLALVEASCLARDWRTGESQISLVEPFRKGEDRYRFYAAVVLFETGKLEPARTLMAQAAPSLASSPYVDHYVKVILGE